MKENFERQRDKEFASHLCAQHPKTKLQEPVATGANTVSASRRKL
jgi:hypothetical protein